MKKISFVILTWNSEKYIDNCLKSILKIKDYKVYIYIADNFSIDSTRKIIDEYTYNFENIFIEKLDKNYGTTYSRNILLKKIKYTDFICVLDSDTIVNQKAINLMINVLEKNEDVGIVGPKLITSSGVVQNSGRNLPTVKEKFLKAVPIKKFQNIGEKMEVSKEDGKIKAVGYLMSACWLMRGEFVQKNGFLDEKIYYAPEDAEYCTRAWAKGYSILYIKDAEIIHEWQRISKKKFFSKMNYEHIKGLIYYWRKYNIPAINKIINKYYIKLNN